MFSEVPTPRVFSAEQENSPLSVDDKLDMTRRKVPESD